MQVATPANVLLLYLKLDTIRWTGRCLLRLLSDAGLHIHSSREPQVPLMSLAGLNWYAFQFGALTTHFNQCKTRKSGVNEKSFYKRFCLITDTLKIEWCRINQAVHELLQPFFSLGNSYMNNFLKPPRVKRTRPGHSTKLVDPNLKLE